MAESITIAGIDLKLLSFERREDEVRGEAPRAFNNTLLDGTDAGKGVWSAVTDALLPATEIALRAAIASGPVVCAGLVLYGGAVLAKVTIGGAPLGPDVVSGPIPDHTAVNASLSLTLREV